MDYKGKRNYQSAQPDPPPEEPTAQMGRNEPFTETEPAKVEPPESEPAEQPPAPVEAQTIPPPVSAQIFSYNPIREILNKAKAVIQTRKRKKLEKILTLFNTKTKITNDEVEKLLHCSDATATRYLSQLEKEGRIKQSGKTGQNVSYSKI